MYMFCVKQICFIVSDLIWMISFWSMFYEENYVGVSDLIHLNMLLLIMFVKFPYVSNRSINL